jgi:hypothetical protein
MREEQGSIEPATDSVVTAQAPDIFDFGRDEEDVVDADGEEHKSAARRQERRDMNAAREWPREGCTVL